MYIKRVQVRNLKSLAEVEWRINTDQAPGWHVIIGDNGAGKSIFVSSIALALVGPDEAPALLEDWNDWLRRETTDGRIQLDLCSDKAYDHFIGKGRISRSSLALALQFVRDRVRPDEVKLKKEPLGQDPFRSVWGGGEGWFSAAYGPFRRFSGSDPAEDRKYYRYARLARHLSVFSESFALTESLNWLEDLHVKQLEGNPAGQFLGAVKQFVNQDGFLPNHTRLDEVTSDGVKFSDGNGCRVWMEDLSDGYRSILSMTLELLRQLDRCYGAERVFGPDDPTTIIAPGVVLIDEVDAHLHPIWQRRIGPWFRRHFPKMQFIVTTHSPFVCQAAEHGTVFKLPAPGSNEMSRMLTGIELDRLLYGNILEAYSTEAFGNGRTRSEASRHRVRKLAELNLKELDGGLTETERSEQQRLRAMFPTTAHLTEREAAK